MGYLIENEVNSKVFSSESTSGERGTLKVSYFPTGENGEGDPDEDLLPEEPEDLLGKAITFRVDIDSAAALPKELSKNVFVTYKLAYERNAIFRTPEFQGKSQAPSFKFRQVHQVDQVTPSLLKYLANGQLCFKVYGYPDFDMAKKAAKKELEESKKADVKADQLKKQNTKKVESKNSD